MNKLYAISAAQLGEAEELDKKMAEGALNNELRASALCSEEEEGQEPNTGYSVLSNGLAVYGISGAMISSSNWYSRYMNIPSYDVINRTLSKMLSDSRVKQVLIKFNSPGGHVSGISEAVAAWGELNAVKPITVHTTEQLASAGIWLAANSSGGIYASETATVGSIGTYRIHSSLQRMRQEEGIEDTIIKTAPLKAAGNPYKDLTDDELRSLEMLGEETSEIFTEHVRTNLPGLSLKAFTGESFVAKRALSYKLIKGIRTFNETFKSLSASADSGNQTSRGGNPVKRQYMTQAMAEEAIGAGADPTSIEIIAEDAFLALQANGGEDAEPQQAQAPENEETVTTEVPDLEALQAEAVQLKSDLEASTVELSALKLEFEELKAKAEAADGLRSIVEARINKMSIGLGASAADLSILSAADLVSKYSDVETSFSASFKPGGVYHAAKTKDNVVQNKEVILSRRSQAALSLI